MTTTQTAQLTRATITTPRPPLHRLESTAVAPAYLEDQARGRVALELARAARAAGLTLTADPHVDAEPIRPGLVHIIGTATATVGA